MGEWGYAVNNVSYGCYGAPYKKPTIFYSNSLFNLISKCDKKFVSFEYAAKMGIERSIIPEKIIQEIFNI